MRTSTVSIMLGITAFLLVLNPILWHFFPVIEPFIQQTSNRVELYWMSHRW